jgi:hypothetical protein
MSSAPTKKTSTIRAQAVHWLLTIATIIYGILGTLEYLKWIPGRYGELVGTLLPWLTGVYLVILAVEKRLASPEELTKALSDSAQDIAQAAPKLEQETQALMNAAEKFAPKDQKK